MILSFPVPHMRGNAALSGTPFNGYPPVAFAPFLPLNPTMLVAAQGEQDTAVPGHTPAPATPPTSSYTRGWNEGCADCETLYDLIAKRQASEVNQTARNEPGSETPPQVEREQEAEYDGGAEYDGIVARQEAASLACFLHTHSAEAAPLGEDTIAYAEGYCEGFAATVGAHERQGHSAAVPIDESPESLSPTLSFAAPPALAPHAASATKSATEATKNPPSPPTVGDSVSVGSAPLLRVVVFAPGQPPQTRDIAHSFTAMQDIVGGLIECFPIGVSGLMGVCNEDYLFSALRPNRTIPATGQHIYGAFFVARDESPDFGSLTDTDIARLLAAFGEAPGEQQHPAEEEVTHYD